MRCSSSGRQVRADRAYQKMIDIRPDLASYVRASYSFQHRGNTEGALTAMRLALESAGPAGEGPAWIRHQLGDIYFGLGDLDEALRQNKLGRRLAPGYVPPTVGVAEVYIARGQIDRAIPILERAAERLPALEYMITLGDLYAADGRTRGSGRSVPTGRRAPRSLPVERRLARRRLHPLLRRSRTASRRRSGRGADHLRGEADPGDLGGVRMDASQPGSRC